MAVAQDILSFWFGEPAASAAELKRKFQRWFVTNPDFDREITARFVGDVERALAGEHDGWKADPRARLALILLLDQFPRSVFRDQPRSFAGDEVALALTVELFDRGLHRTFSLEERLFLIMPLFHAEDLALQRRGGEQARELFADAPEEMRLIYSMAPEQSDKYKNIISQFGRFPHRNQVLGRPSTPAELEFLRDWKASQHPKGMVSPINGHPAGESKP